ncbi:unnamed protein product [Clavelina lepadiformis]|uniref:Uncharacterized protein n=1 Tax=Clavelina lepadiformis TaxID=159417 RepID=A0ABP0H1G7_CLALP
MADTDTQDNKNLLQVAISQRESPTLRRDVAPNGCDLQVVLSVRHIFGHSSTFQV